MGAPHVPPFSTLHLPDILQEASTSNKPLLIYVNSNDVPTDYLLNVICHEVTNAYISESYIAWGVDENSQDGVMAIKLLQISALPTLALVKVRDPRPVVIDRLEGCVHFDILIEFLDRNSNVLNLPEEATRSLRIDNNLVQERLIREQQNRELEEAERIVRERYRAEELKKAQLKKEKDEEYERIRIEEERRINKQKTIGPEPSPGPDIVVMNFRMPDGKKVERRFHKSTQVENLYDYIETLGSTNFDIIHGFPAKALEVKTITLEEAGLYPKSLVYVRDIS